MLTDDEIKAIMRRWRIAFWDWAFRLTNPHSALVSWWCIQRLAAAETDRWLAKEGDRG